MKNLSFDPDYPEKSLRDFVARELQLNPAVTLSQLERLIAVAGGAQCLHELAKQWQLGDPQTVDRLMMKLSAPPTGRMVGAQRGRFRK